MLVMLGELPFLLLRWVLLLQQSRYTMAMLLGVLLERTLVENRALDLRRKRLRMNQIDGLATIRGLLGSLMLLRQTRP